MSWMRSTVVLRVTREHVLCCIRCCGVRRYHPCKQRSLSCASGLRTKHYINVNPRPFSSSALLSANTPPARTEGIAAPSGLENSEWNSDSVNQAVSEIVSEQGGDLASLGLGGYTPVGLIQTMLELIHDHSHLSWWLSIVAMTVILRLSLFPLAVKLQINAARLANLQPQLEEIHLRMTKFRESGNQELLNQEAARMMALYRKHGCNPLKMFIMPFVQFPIFVSFFIALRQMAQLPVTSMKAGGTLWFTDLTLPDPTFVLPLIACASFLANIELGGEGGSTTTNETYKKMKLFLRASAVLILPISSTFPSALFMYWVTNGLFSTCQILLLRVPFIKTTLGIPQITRQRQK